MKDLNDYTRDFREVVPRGLQYINKKILESGFREEEILFSRKRHHVAVKRKIVVELRDDFGYTFQYIGDMLGGISAVAVTELYRREKKQL